MLTINLSGIQYLKIPPSVFDEFFEKSSNFAASRHPEGTEIPVIVVHEQDNPSNTDDEPALAVMLDGCKIGYIPLCSTIEGYRQEARRNNDLAMYEKHSQRLPIAEFLRKSIMQEMERDRTHVMGVLSRVQVSHDTGEVMSVSVSFDYM